jgi:AcrR family transcriptional regulator
MPSASGKLEHTIVKAVRNGEVGRGRVTDIQRARMLTAVTEVACEHGAANVTVTHIVERAGVSRRTFYEIFTDSEDCLLAAIDKAVRRSSERVLDTYRAPGRWRERVRASLVALLGLFEADPCLGRLLIVETLAGGQRALERRAQVLAPVIAAVDEGRAEARGAMAPTELLAEGVVGAVLSVLHSRIRTGCPSLVELTNPLTSMIVLPYLGSSAARRELERPMPEPTPLTRQGQANPLQSLRMRLTYRTMRVLSAVAANPASSNRRVANASGINDPGQISKLLARLERLGLVENRELGGPARGEPNAWILTTSGEGVHRTLVAERAA